jgi:hypothetical protein
MFCTKCGKELSAEDLFCARCGVPIKLEAPPLASNTLPRNDLLPLPQATTRIEARKPLNLGCRIAGSSASP